ncbi:DUF2007 domain-containing protein [Pseudoxanthomonas suwonensis]|jgi:Protein of unknown function (DUF2007).|uniref:putative signal transducing protein n=1 Tax=Pseudoxanthomonas suwonensis TaxID=314722 RepID=UPI000465122C|nr:DUF2007 domain-containing protein [Pseudoxanthomonas suwonensis]
MQVAYRANNLIDAHLARHVLEDAGIPAFVFGENLLGGAGELPLFGVLRVCVPDSSLPEADAALRAAGLRDDPQDPIPEAEPGLLPA